ncbi:MAG: bifunctional adenosylcobinamide kinase/adenosylcobinamide-phosphate guanylyltransferase [Zoogloeaceae bacterium]|jgi:adenosylcobinamide kinase/adenosylcobinamide-phosphate guanylyltransferase|nr:bifunctional adenosylcobinamide kinase/adenosylcobinamide-phosphate guanylyltransferase [Zoogloeaceae bacterium]
MAELILGGARSGKSGEAERRAQAAEAAGCKVIYIATAEARDAEMARRIARHRATRPNWETQEAPIALAASLAAAARPQTCLLVDCLTLWLSNLFFAGATAQQAETGAALACPLLARETAALLDTLPHLPGRVLLVSNEVGCGIIPGNPVSRAFADAQGRLNQQVAAISEQVTLMAAGLPLRLK